MHACKWCKYGLLEIVLYAILGSWWSQGLLSDHSLCVCVRVQVRACECECVQVRACECECVHASVFACGMLTYHDVSLGPSFLQSLATRTARLWSRSHQHLLQNANYATTDREPLGGLTAGRHIVATMCLSLDNSLLFIVLVKDVLNSIKVPKSKLVDSISKQFFGGTTLTRANGNRCTYCVCAQPEQSKAEGKH
eukprot:1155773-Pelagomonas_calceolata.AAC.9